VHALGDVHETPVSCAGASAVGSGIGSLDQALPFQRSASAAIVLPARSTLEPTTVHELADVHDTPVNVAPVVVPVIGDATIDQPDAAAAGVAAIITTSTASTQPRRAAASQSGILISRMLCVRDLE
jgi:hypothetical protein